MRVCVGGTFNVFHRAHEELLERSFGLAGPEGMVLVGLTSDRFAGKGRSGPRPYAERECELRRRLRRLGSNFEVIEIDTVKGFAVDMDLDAMVVSDETKRNAALVNRARRAKGKRELEIVSIGRVLAQDGLLISATRVLASEIDGEGNIQGKVTVRVGSENPVKARAVRNVLKRFFDDIDVRGVKVSSSVPEQPRGRDTVKGAINRAREALGDAHFGVGIEAGVFYERHGKCWLDVQYCAIVDRGGRLTLGQGPGFAYPQSIVDAIHDGKEVGQAMRDLFGVRDSGWTKGAISYLTRGELDRTCLTEQAVLAAYVPRIRGELYRER